jgi:tetratricopeptide (TPR) repeat protein
VKKNFEKAKGAYAQAVLLDIHNPKPQYYAAECYLALGQREDALATLATLFEYCTGTDDVTKEFRAKAEELKKKIEG